MYQNIFKEGIGGHKYLRCTYLRYTIFEVLHLEIELDKIDLDCAENIRSKPVRNYSGFITYSNTINFGIKVLDKSGYIITH